MVIRYILIASALILFASGLKAAHLVPSQYATIQAAVDASVTDDTIAIEPGLYAGEGFVNITIDGMKLTIIGLAGAENTILQFDRDFLEGAFEVTDIAESGLSNLILRGLSFQDAYTTINCGAHISIEIAKCRFSNCYKVVADTVYVPEVPNVIGVIDSCYVTGSAIGLDMKSNSVWEVSNSIFFSNADALSFFEDTALQIRDNIFAYNNDNIYLAFTNLFHFENNVFLRNRYAIFADLQTTSLIAICNDFFENVDNYWWMADPVGTNGNFSADPLFCDSVIQYPLVMLNSPLLPENNECGVNIGNVSVGCICADIDNSGASPDISDLTYLVEYMFNGGAAPVYLNTADLDGAGGINITDLTTFVDYLFGGGDSPDCSAS